jgi:hypothetical protein
MVENRSSTAACSTHRDSNYSMSDSRHNSRPEIQNLLPELRTSERENAAPERKPIHLPVMRLRKAFSSVFSSLLVALGRGTACREGFLDA